MMQRRQLSFLLKAGTLWGVGVSLILALSWRVSPRFRRLASLDGDPALYSGMIEEAADRHGVAPNLIRGVIRQESGFQPRVVGGAGEIGLMQITPVAAKDWCAAHGVDYRFRGWLCDPRFNIEVGTWYLARGLRRWEAYDDKEVLALAEYNAGRGRVKRWLPDDPSEKAIGGIGFSSTKAYITRILKFRDMYDQKAPD
ncbi:MAG: lytic transglycosylase domain-containing protein [Lentisphaeria bacterium]|nr:lytic transglycosylase domain-containing protein [Lentisphaeria bacterium]